MNVWTERTGMIAWILGVCVLCVGTNAETREPIVGVAPVDAPVDAPVVPAERKNGWLSQRDEETGRRLETMEMTLYPADEPQPALQHRFIPDEYELKDGNAAIYYLKALGFLEQSGVRQRLEKFQRDASARAIKEGLSADNVPPGSWGRMPPQDLPIERVKEYLGLTSFQTGFLREAAARDRFDMDRKMSQIKDPISYLLPEIQTMRQLARTQSLRCRLAIAEGRIDDAMTITGQQFAMARHLGQDEFLVSNLVGLAVAQIAWNDALFLVQQSDTPNLYWALASMPKSLVDIRKSMAGERQFLYAQVKILREVDATPRPAGYWQDFLDRLVTQLGGLEGEFGLPSSLSDPLVARAAISTYIVGAFPGARDYLITELGMDPKRVAALPTAQVVMLAAVRFYDQWRDEYFKWTYLPLWQIQGREEFKNVDKRMRQAVERYGLCGMPAQLLLPAVQAVRTAEARMDHAITMLQTVEAIRMYAARHEGRLPATLDDLPVPAPVAIFTGKPIQYRLRGDRAVLTGSAFPGIRHQLVLRMGSVEE